MPLTRSELNKVASRVKSNSSDAASSYKQYQKIQSYQQNVNAAKSTSKDTDWLGTIISNVESAGKSALGGTLSSFETAGRDIGSFAQDLYGIATGGSSGDLSKELKSNEQQSQKDIASIGLGSDNNIGSIIGNIGSYFVPVVGQLRAASDFGTSVAKLASDTGTNLAISNLMGDSSLTAEQKVNLSKQAVTPLATIGDATQAALSALMIKGGSSKGASAAIKGTESTASKVASTAKSIAKGSAIGAGFSTSELASENETDTSKYVQAAAEGALAGAAGEVAGKAIGSAISKLKSRDTNLTETPTKTSTSDTTATEQQKQLAAGYRSSTDVASDIQRFQSGEFTDTDNVWKATTSEKTPASQNVESLKSDIQISKDKIKTLQSKIDSIPEGSEGATQRVAEIRTQIDSERNKISDANDAIDKANTGVSETTGKEIDPEKVKQQFSALQQEYQTSVDYEKSLAEAQTPTRSTSEISDDISRLQNGVVNDTDDVYKDVTVSTSDGRTISTADTKAKIAENNSKLDELSSAASKSSDQTEITNIVKEANNITSENQSLEKDLSDAMKIAKENNQLEVDDAKVSNKIADLNNEYAASAKAKNEKFKSDVTTNLPSSKVISDRIAAVGRGEYPDEVYVDRPEATTAMEVADNMGDRATDGIKAEADTITNDRLMLDNMSKGVMTPEKAEAVKQNIDNEYKAKTDMTSNNTEMSPMRKKYEQKKLDDEYGQQMQDVDDQVAQDAEKSKQIAAIKDGIDKREQTLIDKYNVWRGSADGKVVDEAKLQEYRDTLESQKYMDSDNPSIDTTNQILDNTVNQDKLPSTEAEKNPVVHKAQNESIRSSSMEYEAPSEGVKGRDPNLVDFLAGDPVDVLPKLDSVNGKKIAKILVDANDAKAVSNSIFYRYMKNVSKDIHSKEDNALIHKALDGDSKSMSEIKSNDRLNRAYTAFRDYYDDRAKQIVDISKNRIDYFNSKIDAFNKELETTVDDVDRKNLESGIKSAQNSIDKMNSRIEALSGKNRIKNYVNHVFKNGIGKADEALAQLRSGVDLDGNKLTYAKQIQLEKEISGLSLDAINMVKKNSVFKVKNGFLSRRTGAEGYDISAVDAINLYQHSSVNTIYMEPAFDKVADLSKTWNEDSKNYLAKVIYRLEGRNISDTDSYLSNQLKQISGKENLSYANLSNKARTAVFNATIGFNTRSATTNLSQSSFTVARIGYGWTARGTKEALTSINNPEIKEMIMNNGIIMNSQTEFLNGLKKISSGANTADEVMNKTTKAMFLQFNTVENLNRTSAFLGGYRKAANEGITAAEAEKYGIETGKVLSGSGKKAKYSVTEEGAQKYGKNITEETQFNYDAMHTPLALQTTTGKSLFQLNTYNLKAAKYIASWFGGKPDSMFAKGADGKYTMNTEAAGKVMRYITANLLFYSTIGSVTGATITNAIPFYEYLTTGELPKSPLVSLFTGSNEYGTGGLISTGKDIAGFLSGDGTSSDTVEKDIQATAWNMFATLFPAGSQIKKTIQGVQSELTGVSTNASGNIRFMQDTDAASKLRATLFGQYSTEAGKKWVSGGAKTLSSSQTKTIQDQENPLLKQKYYDYYSTVKSAPSYSTTYNNVKSAIAEGDTNKAQRIANEYNSQLNKALTDYFNKYDTIPDDIKQDFSSRVISAQTIQTNYINNL